MSKKSRREREQPGDEAPRSLHPLLLIGGAIAVVAAFAGIAILVFTWLGGASLSEEDPDIPAIPTLTSELPEFGRSAAADLLEGKSLDDMTPEELALVKSEAERVYANAEVRLSSKTIPALDIVRRDGRTRISRQYVYTDSPGGAIVLGEIVAFYCDSNVAGFVDVYKSRTRLGTTTTEPGRIESGAQPFDEVLSATDWTAAKDLGFEEIEGRRAHRFEVQRTLQSGSQVAWQLWLDVETAQLLRSADGAAPDNPYTLDWRKPAKIIPATELGTPPCYAAIYGD